MKKKIIALTLSLAMALSISACGTSSNNAPASGNGTSSSSQPAPSAPGSEPNGPVITAKMGHVVATDSAYHYGAETFARLVDEKSNGQIKIEVYPNSQLGGDRDLLEGLAMNSVQFSLPGGLTLAQYEPVCAVFSMPFLYESREDAYKVLDSELAEEVFSTTIDHGFRVLGCIEKGFNQLATRNTPITGLSDVKGMKIRVPESDLYMKTWTLLGAAPTPMAWNEVFSALQTGVVDGEEAPLSSFAASGFGEVAKHFAFINYLYDPVCITVSEQFYQSLTDEQRAILDEAAAEAVEIQRAWVAEDDLKKQKEQEEMGVTFYNPPLAEFQAAVQPLYDEFENPEVLEQVLAALGR